MAKKSCEAFKIQKNHYGNKVRKRCKSIAIKEINGKEFCINCFNHINSLPAKG